MAQKEIQTTTEVVKQNKRPKWKGVLNLACWENDDGSLYLKIGDMGIYLNKNAQ
jgi:hypothetical protein